MPNPVGASRRKRRQSARADALLVWHPCNPSHMHQACHCCATAAEATGLTLSGSHTCWPLKLVSPWHIPCKHAHLPGKLRGRPVVDHAGAPGGVAQEVDDRHGRLPLGVHGVEPRRLALQPLRSSSIHSVPNACAWLISIIRAVRPDVDCCSRQPEGTSYEAPMCLTIAGSDAQEL